MTFVHGDIRNPADLAPLGRDLDLLLECSAEPSVLAGYDGDPSYVIDTNLVGHGALPRTGPHALARPCCSCPRAASTRSPP